MTEQAKKLQGDADVLGTLTIERLLILSVILESLNDPWVEPTVSMIQDKLQAMYQHDIVDVLANIKELMRVGIVRKDENHYIYWLNPDMPALAKVTLQCIFADIDIFTTK